MDNRAFCPDEDQLNIDKDLKDEAFEEYCSSSIEIQHSFLESQPININRPIFYTEDFYSKNSILLNNKSCKRKNNNGKNVSFTDRIMEVSRSLLPARTSPSEIKTRSICLTWLQTLFPILNWLPNYDVKNDLISDIVAGCTILALHIPQGLAYAKLAGVEPINGLYVSLFPVIIYSIFGTSRQVSIGTFAVISIACKDALESFDLNQNVILSLINGTNDSNLTTIAPLPSDLPNAIDVLTALCLFVGIIQFFLGFFQLGILSIILPETLLSAFVNACSFHVFTSQIFALIDIESKGDDDLEIPIPFDIIKSWIRFITRAPNANLTTLIISIICISTLIICKYGLEPYLHKRFKLKNVVIPIDILVIVFTTLISSLMDLNGEYKVQIIPNIPKAFEGMPKVPDLSHFSKLYASAILITIISYISTYSLGKMYGKQHGYEVSANQELIALGASNMVSSFLLCYPCSGSLARSAVMDKVGARTQLASLVASVLMILFLLFFSGFLRCLPKAVLSCIIVVALYSTMKKITQVKTAWKASKLDGILWVVTFLLVILFGVGHGILYSVLFSFVILIIKLVIPIIKLKRQVKDSEVFIEIGHIYDLYDPKTGSHNKFKINNTNWVVFEFQGPLIFLNSFLFKNKFHNLIGRYLIDQKHLQISSKKRQTEMSIKLEHCPSSIGMINTIIFDCIRLTYIDAKGVETLLEICRTIEQNGSHLVLASCSQMVFDSLKANGFFQQFNVRHCYMSVLDAIADIEHHPITTQPIQ